MNRNIKLKITYDGTGYCGWQRQESEKNNYPTIQGEIEKALKKIHGKDINLTGSGRTDSGVHAAGQIANFYTDINSIPADRFAPALNSLLPFDIRILEACEVSSDFHARFSAKARFYRYQFLCRSNWFNPALPFESRFNLHLNRFPDIELLNSYSRLILGEIDCSIFTAAGDSSAIAGKSLNRYIYRAYFYAEKDRLIFEICANAFLRSMVRSVAGTFLHYEDLNLPPEKLQEIISKGERALAGPTLPPQGLYLWQVEY
ncbi:MAG: tRNA pseudouridine(38-40) synthase TruA [Treponema sp.]|nr:tRNA pseudouridine(38-40) synthase TruA [Treponema sp.]